MTTDEPSTVDGTPNVNEGDIPRSADEVVAELMEERLNPSQNLFGQMILCVVLIGWFTFAALEASDFPRVAVWFPRYVSITGATLSLLMLIRLIRLANQVGAWRGDNAEGAAPRSVSQRVRSAILLRTKQALASWFTWTLVLIVLLVQFGTTIALVIWVPLTYLWRSKASIKLTVGTGVGIAIVLYGLSEVIGMRLP